MLSLGKIKRGDTFAFFTNLTDAGGLPLAAGAENIHCQIRGLDRSLLSDMVVTATETTGKYLFKVTDTGAFPLGSVRLDIRVVVDGITKTTDTMELTVEEEVTRLVE